MTSQTYLAQVRFIFPFNMGLSDSAYFFDFEGVATYIGAWCGLASRRFVFVPEEKRPEGVERKWHKINAVRIDKSKHHARTVVVAETEDLYVEEVNDSVGFTRIDAYFESRGEYPPPDAAIKELRQAAMARVQHFVRVHRILHQDYAVFVPTEDDSFAEIVWCATEYKLDKNEAEGHFQPVGRTVRWERAVRTGIAKQGLSDEQERQLAARLREGKVPRLHDELLLEAKALTTLYGEHRLSIVVAQSAFEAYVQWRIAFECKFRNITELTTRQGKSLSVSDAIERGNLKADLLGEYAGQLAGKSVKSCPEYQRWDQRAYLARNEVIHTGRTSVSESEANEAGQAIVAYIHAIDRLLIDGRAQV